MLLVSSLLQILVLISPILANPQWVMLTPFCVASLEDWRKDGIR
jgi:hypothetical protein